MRREVLLASLLLAVAIIPIAEASSLTVVALDEETSEPVSGAVVVLQSPTEARAVTGESGRAVFSQLLENVTYSGYAAHLLYQVTEFEALVRGDAVIEVKLLRTRGIVELQVLNAILGKPIPSAIVSIYGPADGTGGWEPLLRTVKTNEQGVAALELVAGLYSINVTAEGYWQLESVRMIWGEGRLLLALIPMRSPAYIDPLLVASIGWLLGLVNYYGGCFLMTLPIGHRGVKGLGRTMVEDGAIYAFFMAIYGTVFLLVHAIWQLLYGVGSTSLDAYAGLFAFCGENIETAVGAAGGILIPLMTLGWVTVGFAAQVVNAISNALSPIVSSLIWVAQFNAILAAFSTFVLTTWPAFLSIGALLYGVPARIGRYAGAGLMSFALVYYIGLPLLPTSASALVGATSASLGEALHSLLTPFAVPTGLIDALRTITILVSGFYLGALVFPILYLLVLAALTAGLAYALGGAPVFRVPLVTRW